MEFKVEKLSDEEKKAAHELFKKQPTFMLGVAALSQLPNAILPEIAFA